MAGASLLTLLDDIATLLDDVALMSKVAAKKTTGLLGDDLALNAEQVLGAKEQRELPIVWAVAKGSFLNKLIIVPFALALSAFLPIAITIALIIGGLYLSFEGFEKVFHSLTHRRKPKEKTPEEETSTDEKALEKLEKEKIKGAIKTDFILSAEIIIVGLGAVSSANFITQVIVIVFLSIALTIGVYCLVAAIVRLDNVGFFLLRKAKSKDSLLALFGKGLINFAPILMKFLVVVGTAAMFLVGGGIILHKWPWLAELSHHMEHAVAAHGQLGVYLNYLMPTLLALVVGVVMGGAVFILLTLLEKTKQALFN